MDRAICADRNAGRLLIGAVMALSCALDGCSSPLSSKPNASAQLADAGFLPAGEVTGLLFSATSGERNPAAPDSVSVTDPSKARDAYNATLALPDFPRQDLICPLELSVRYRLTFFFDDGSSLIAILNPCGCNDVQIPGTTQRRALADAYWSALAQDLGITESAIYPIVPPGQQSDGGAQPGGACRADVDCPSGLTCGYPVANGCAAAGSCIQSNCQGGVCITPAGMCGCDGQTILPVMGQISANSITILYASAPASGRVGPCPGVPLPDAGGRD